MFEKCHAKVHFRLWFTFVTSTTQTTPTKCKRVRVTKKHLRSANSQSHWTTTTTTQWRFLYMSTRAREHLKKMHLKKLKEIHNTIIIF